MRLLHKTPQSLRSATARTIPPSRPTPDTPLCTAANETCYRAAIRGAAEGLRAAARLTLDGRKDLGTLSARCQFNSALSERSWTS